MALIARLGRLFRADVHAMLDRIEEPAEMLRQAIRDMEAELAAGESRIRAAAAARDRLATRRDALAARLADTDAELDLCFGEGKDELARPLVRRKLETGRLLARVESRLDETGRELAERSRRLDSERTALEGLRQKADVFAAAEPADSDADSLERDLLRRELSIGEDEVEVAFLREQRARRAT